MLNWLPLGGGFASILWRIGQAGELSSERGSGGERRLDRRAGGGAIVFARELDRERCRAAGVPEEVEFTAGFFLGCRGGISPFVPGQHAVGWMLPTAWKEIPGMGR